LFIIIFKSYSEIILIPKGATKYYFELFQCLWSQSLYFNVCNKFYSNNSMW